MIDAADAGREWGLRFSEISLADEELSERALDEFWPRSRAAITRPTWSYRRGLRATWYALIVLLVGTHAYQSVVSALVDRPGSVGQSAEDDLRIIGSLATAEWILLTLVGISRILVYMTYGLPAITQARQDWTRTAISAALAGIQVRRRQRSPRPPAPEPQRYGIVAASAPQLVMEWMRHLGEADCKQLDLERTGAHIGSARMVARVWHRVEPVSASDLKDLAAAAFMHKREPAAFTIGDYAPEAHRLADGRIALFRYSPERGTLEALNSVAERLRSA